MDSHENTKSRRYFIVATMQIYAPHVIGSDMLVTVSLECDFEAFLFS
uniref:Uncharacterized protein n=1 Tax=Rhizophora mucronata TaxID=61149 RepID=A0A2P2P1A1_RHIMU